MPQDSRPGRKGGHLHDKAVDPANIVAAQALNAIASDRGQTLAQLALSWILRHDTVTSVIIGASRVEQIADNLGAAANTLFADDELGTIESILTQRRDSQGL